MIYLKLFLQFFKTGLFAFGGGYAILPFLYDISKNEHWYTLQQLSDMIAISSITPGPVGLNMATFAGFVTKGITGSLIATTAIVLPSYIIIIAVSKLINKFEHNKLLQEIIYLLKPISCGLIAAVGFNMLISNVNFYGIIFLAILLFISTKQKHNPLFYLAISAIFGLFTTILP